MSSAHDVFTIGHSNLPAERFLTLLAGAGITAVADVRSVPASRRFPWFSAKALASNLLHRGISYIGLGDTLGGARAIRRSIVTGSRTMRLWLAPANSTWA